MLLLGCNSARQHDDDETLVVWSYRYVSSIAQLRQEIEKICNKKIYKTVRFHYDPGHDTFLFSPLNTIIQCLHQLNVYQLDIYSKHKEFVDRQDLFH